MNKFPEDVIIKYFIVSKTEQNFCLVNKRIFDIYKRNKNYIHNEIFRNEYGPRLLYQTKEPDYTNLAAWSIMHPNWIDSYERTCLIKAIRDNNVELAKKLIAIKHYFVKDKDHKNNEWKPISVINKQDRNGRTALMYATGSTEIVKLLLQAGAKIDIQDLNGDTALMIASNYGHTKVIQLLLQAGANTEIPDNSGISALMYTCAYTGHAEVVQLLLKAKAKIDIQDDYGYTALMCASCNRNIEIVKLLIEYGININAQNKVGYTALMHACTYTFTKSINIKIVELLIQAGANVDIQDKNGNTALMLASDNGHTETVKLLLESGANPDIRDKYDRTALTVASRSGHTEIIKLLEYHEWLQ